MIFFPGVVEALPASDAGTPVERGYRYHDDASRVEYEVLGSFIS